MKEQKKLKYELIPLNKKYIQFKINTQQKQNIAQKKIKTEKENDLPEDLQAANPTNLAQKEYEANDKSFDQRRRYGGTYFPGYFYRQCNKGEVPRCRDIVRRSR